jgi:hypothetical protein
LYVGFGVKRGDVCFNPTEPPEVQKDPKEQPEQPEVSLIVSYLSYSLLLCMLQRCQQWISIQEPMKRPRMKERMNEVYV